ncbi:MAG: transposase [Acidimicrobiales bacterium]|nr:transposase [Acidimicrobiales bacterium]MYH74282.1 transposase [Acidimicrobiales bacterium]MYK71423.1 transposase [Acidimicrobiales bacterium]
MTGLADAVALVLDEGRTIASVARSLGIGESNLGNWVRQAGTVRFFVYPAVVVFIGCGRRCGRRSGR